MEVPSFGCDACDCKRNQRDTKKIIAQTLARSYYKYNGIGRYHQWYYCFKDFLENDKISYYLKQQKLTITANIKKKHIDHHYYFLSKYCCEDEKDCENSKKCDPSKKCEHCNERFCHKFKVPKSKWTKYKEFGIDDYHKKAPPTNEPNKIVYGGICIVYTPKTKLTKIIPIKPLRLCMSHICVCGIFSKSRDKDVCKMCRRSVKRKQKVSYIRFENYMNFRQIITPGLAIHIYELLLKLHIK